MTDIGGYSRQVLLALVAGGMVLAAGAEEYLREIKPVLKERCYACHGSLKQKSGLRVDTAAAILEGGENGPVVVAGDAAASPLLARLTHESADERMPAEGKPLAPEEIAVIRRWIEAGAPVPPNEVGEDDPGNHWAFQKIERPDVPGSGARHPIDAFLDARRDAESLRAQPPAEKAIQLRRLYLDLIGLPPSREQLGDQRPWEEIVNELLESPQHAERWARHFMDIWRYSDWYGLGEQLRNSQKHMWHWRDWIIDSLQADKGYDRMIHEMLAGDELAPEDLSTVRATGFLARNYYLFNRTSWLDNTIEHTSKAFLGLTMNCAKCHDHKYDPIEMTDYYRFRAIFEPHQVRLDEAPGEPDLKKDGIPRVFDNHLEAPTWLHRRGDSKDPDKEQTFEPGVPVLLAGFAPPVEEVGLPYVAWVPGARPHVQEARLAAAEQELKKAEETLAQVEIVAGESVTTGSQQEPAYLIDDAFDRLDEDVWVVEGDDWQFRDGALHKKTANRENKVVRSKEPHPRNFEVTCRYTVTSGTTYKSVGVRFDRINEGDDQSQVYTSAHAPDPKVQVSHTVKGKDQYPPAGKVKRPIKVGETYELRFAVRDDLLNVWLNGEFVLAYTLPRRHAGGTLAISGFDAVVAFDSLKLRALPDDYVLQPAGKKGAPVTVDAARQAVEKAGKTLRSVRHTIAIDRARMHGEELPEDVKEEEYQPLKASQKALETPEHKFEQYPSTWPEKSTGRRTMLARWMTHRDNPLTARVAVNHVWMRHFGEPLVDTVFDFGRRAVEPGHLALLDFLAVELIDSGWSLRHLHRLMVTSDAYRRNSSNLGADEARERDPENRLYWRMNPRRMEAEVVRDSLLELAGALDRTVGGPSLDPAKGGMRRSLYFRHSRDDKEKLLTTFDGPDHLRCYRRSASIVPQQALALSNSRLALEMAEKISGRLREEAPDLDAFIRVTFEEVLSRQPDPGEEAACRDFCERMRETTRASDIDSRVRVRLVHALLNHNDFVTIR